MKKLLIIPALMLITGCASVSKVEVNPNVSFNQQEFKQAEKKIDREQFEADVSGKTSLKEELATAIPTFVGSFAGAAAGGGSFVSSQAFGYVASEFATKAYMKTVPKNSWVVERIFYKPAIPKSNKFNLILVYPSKKKKEDLNSDVLPFLFRSGQVGFKRLFSDWFVDKDKVLLSKEPTSNKLIVYIIDGRRMIKGNIADKYPWIKAMADVYINGKLSARYLLYGVALRPPNQGAIPELYKRITEDFLKNSTVASK